MILSQNCRIDRSIPGYFHYRGLDFIRVFHEFKEKYLVEKDGCQIAIVKLMSSGQVQIDYSDLGWNSKVMYSTAFGDMAVYSRQFTNDTKRERWLDFIAVTINGFLDKLEQKEGKRCNKENAIK